MRGLSERQKVWLAEIRGRVRDWYSTGNLTARDIAGLVDELAEGRVKARADVRWLLKEWAEDRKSLKNLLRMYYELLAAVVNETDERRKEPWLYAEPISGTLEEKIVAALRMAGKRQVHRRGTENTET